MAPPVLPRELVYLPLAELSPDETFRLRPAGDVSSLAQSIAQVGQLSPIEVRLEGGSYQAITGFRRLAALQMLHRQRVLARVHPRLDEGTAALIAAADCLDTAPLEVEALQAMQERYQARGWSTPALAELIQRAIEKANERIEDIAALLRGEEAPDRSVPDEDSIPDPEADGTKVEDAGPTAPPPTLAPPSEAPSPQPLLAPAQALPLEAFAETTARQLAMASQGLDALASNWEELPATYRELIREQLAYYRSLEDWIEGKMGETA